MAGGSWKGEHGVLPVLAGADDLCKSAPAAADTLVDIREHCPQVFDRCEVIVDGGM